VEAISAPLVARKLVYAAMANQEPNPAQPTENHGKPVPDAVAVEMPVLQVPHKPASVAMAKVVANPATRMANPGASALAAAILQPPPTVETVEPTSLLPISLALPTTIAPPATSVSKMSAAPLEIMAVDADAQATMAIRRFLSSSSASSSSPSSSASVELNLICSGVCRV
jgi:hypothetical protein